MKCAHYILRGLVYLLVSQEKGIVRHPRKRYDDHGRPALKGPEAAYTLRLILRDILNDPAFPQIYLLIDALDERSEGLHLLLDTITDASFTMRKTVKWLVASRPHPHIAERLRPDDI